MIFSRFLIAVACLATMPARSASACDQPTASARSVRDAERAVRDAERAILEAEPAGRDASPEAVRVARRAVQRAATAFARDAVRAARDAMGEQLRAELRKAAGLQSGVVLTPEALLFVDGPEVPLEEVEWADESGARRVRRATVTDTVLHIGPGVTLALANLSGDIAVEVWNRSDVRVQAEHDRDDRISSELKDNVLTLGVRSRWSEPAEVEWKLTVPAWLPLRLSGMESEIEVTGMRSAVRAQSMRGDVMVRACQGTLEVNSVEGEVHVTDVSGLVNAGSVNNVIRLVRVTGTVEAQTINGDIQLEKLASSSVDASTVNGRVFFASPFLNNGRYAFSSHNGRLYVGVPSDQRVKVKVSSFNGQVESSVPMPGPLPRGRTPRFDRGRSVRFVTGELANAPQAPEVPESPQAPELELASFGGLIQLGSQDEVLRAIDRQRAALDIARAALLRARRELARARRLNPPAEASAAPEPPTPPRH